MLLQKNRPSKHVMVHAHWCRVKPLSAVIKWSRLQSSECWDQTQIIMHCARQHCTTWWSDWKFVRTVAEHTSQPGTLCSQTPPFPNPASLKCGYLSLGSQLETSGQPTHLLLTCLSVMQTLKKESQTTHGLFYISQPYFSILLYFISLIPRLFHRLKIRRFSCSLAELFLAPPHSCSVSGI